MPIIMTIGILCAIPEETKAFGSGLNILSTQRVGDNAFHSGKLYGVDMTLVECGIGKVNAAFATTILCDHFKCSSLIFSGIAGGIDPELQVGDVVIADRLLQVDYGRFQDGAVIPFRAGNVPFGAAVGEIGYV
ncbi:MAG TPA: 5'-methylthioadenosine/S-adenosylhomocysteine nucleosidase, partial [Alphaproteobacteria bacterium]|nr:5'-methylthioadenosine/S-adenosylhomocysteine nucleosidase [Alphaproteobacteria bacterium]